MLAMIMVLSVAYFVTVNSLGTKGYEISQLKAELKQLEARQKNLELQTSNLQSINRIQQEMQMLNFVPSQEVTYIKESDYALK